MTRCGRAVVFLVLVGAMTAGCSDAATGDDRAGPFPPRPADLRVDQVLPCDALTDDQSTGLGAGPGSNDADAVYPGECLWKTGDNQFWTVRIQPQNPIAQFDPRDPLYIGNEYGQQNPEITSVDGYGAVRFGYGLGIKPVCNLALDVAPNASVVVGFANNPSEDPRYPAPLSFEQRCSEATRVASMVLSNLRSRTTG